MLIFAKFVTCFNYVLIVWIQSFTGHIHIPKYLFCLAFGIINKH